MCQIVVEMEKKFFPEIEGRVLFFCQLYVDENKKLPKSEVLIVTSDEGKNKKN